MSYGSINLENELKKERTRLHAPSKTIKDTVREWIKQAEREDEQRLKTAKTVDFSQIQEEDTAALTTDNTKIFSIDEIRNLCIKFRLRFLDFKHFNGHLPYEAMQEMKSLEERVGKPLRNYKIVAPASLFELSDKDSDPLLFLSLGNGRYYLVHKWGNDLKWYRRITAYPFRSLLHFIFFLVVSAMLIAQIAPIGTFPDVDSVGILSIYRLYLFAYTLIYLCALSVLLLFSFRKNFSDLEWKSRYFS